LLHHIVFLNTTVLKLPANTKLTQSAYDNGGMRIG
jgi:hypothetical protein